MPDEAIPEFDVVVVGGGAAGLVSSGIAAAFGLNVALISDGPPGGECLWTGCVPSKALIHRAAVAHTVARETAHCDMDEMFTKAMKHMRDARHRISHHDSVETVETKNGVRVILGKAQFIDTHLLDVQGSRVRARKIIIATGAYQQIPDIPGLRESNCLTHESILDLAARPGSMLIIGGGPVGVEYAQVLLRLGVKVTLADTGNRLLKKEEVAVSTFAQQTLLQEGAKIALGREIESVTIQDGQKHVALRIRDSGQHEKVVCDEILIATGKTPNTAPLLLMNANIQIDDRGYIQVNKHQRTSTANIWACGDVCGGFQFTHYADHTARVAAMNACLGVPVSHETRVVPRCTFTDPEIAAVGLNEDEAVARFGRNRVTVIHYDLSDFDRSIVDAVPVGFIRCVLQKDGKILGVSIAGARAGELIHEFALTMQRNLRIQDIAQVIHAYPTMSSAIWILSSLYYKQALGGTWQERLLRQWARLLR